MANSVCWSCIENDRVIRRALMLEAEGQRKQGRLKMIWKKQDEEENMKQGRCTSQIKVDR